MIKPDLCCKEQELVPIMIGSRMSIAKICLNCSKIQFLNLIIKDHDLADKLVIRLPSEVKEWERKEYLINEARILKERLTGKEEKMQKM